MSSYLFDSSVISHEGDQTRGIAWLNIIVNGVPLRNNVRGEDAINLTKLPNLPGRIRYAGFTLTGAATTKYVAVGSNFTVGGMTAGLSPSNVNGLKAYVKAWVVEAINDKYSENINAGSPMLNNLDRFCECFLEGHHSPIQTIFRKVNQDNKSSWPNIEPQANSAFEKWFNDHDVNIVLVTNESYFFVRNGHGIFPMKQMLGANNQPIGDRLKDIKTQLSGLKTGDGRDFLDRIAHRKIDPRRDNIAVHVNLDLHIPDGEKYSTILEGHNIMWAFEDEDGDIQGVEVGSSNAIKSFFLATLESDLPPGRTLEDVPHRPAGLLEYNQQNESKFRNAVTKTIEAAQESLYISESDKETRIQTITSAFRNANLSSYLEGLGVKDLVRTSLGYMSYKTADVAVASNESFFDIGSSINIPVNSNVASNKYIVVQFVRRPRTIRLILKLEGSEPEIEDQDLKMKWVFAANSDYDSNLSLGFRTTSAPFLTYPPKNHNTVSTQSFSGDADISDIDSQLKWSLNGNNNCEIQNISWDMDVLIIEVKYSDPSRTVRKTLESDTGEEISTSVRNSTMGTNTHETSYGWKIQNMEKHILKHLRRLSGGSIEHDGPINLSYDDHVHNFTVTGNMEVVFVYRIIPQIHLTKNYRCKEILPFLDQRSSGYEDLEAILTKEAPVGFTYMGIDYDLVEAVVTDLNGVVHIRRPVNLSSQVLRVNLGGLSKGTYTIDFIYQVRPKFELEEIKTLTSYEVWPLVGDPYSAKRYADIIYSVLNIDENTLVFDVHSKNGLIERLSIVRSFTPGHGMLEWNLLEGTLLRDQTTGLLYDDITFSVTSDDGSRTWCNETFRIFFIENPNLHISTASLELILEKDDFGDEVKDIAMIFSMVNSWFIDDSVIQVVSRLQDNALNGLTHTAVAQTLQHPMFSPYVVFAVRNMKMEDIFRRLRLRQHTEWTSPRTGTLYRSSYMFTDVPAMPKAPWLTDINVDKDFILQQISYVSNLLYESNQFLTDVETDTRFINPEGIGTDIQVQAKPNLPSERRPGQMVGVPLNCKDIEGIVTFQMFLVWTYVNNVFKNYNGGNSNNMTFERLYVDDSYYVGFFIEIIELDITNEEDGEIKTEIGTLFPYITQTMTRMRVINLTTGNTLFDSGPQLRPSEYSDLFYYDPSALRINHEYEFIYEATPYRGFGVLIRNPVTIVEKRNLLCEERIDDLGMTITLDIDTLEYIVKGRGEMWYSGYDNLSVRLLIKDKNGKEMFNEFIPFTVSAGINSVRRIINYEGRVHILDGITDYNIKNISDVKVIYEYDS